MVVDTPKGGGASDKFESPKWRDHVRGITGWERERREREMERGAERQRSSYHQYPFSRGTYEQGLGGSCEVGN